MDRRLDPGMIYGSEHDVLVAAAYFIRIFLWKFLEGNIVRRGSYSRPSDRDQRCRECESSRRSALPGVALYSICVSCNFSLGSFCIQHVSWENNLSVQEYCHLRRNGFCSGCPSAGMADWDCCKRDRSSAAYSVVLQGA